MQDKLSEVTLILIGSTLIILILTGLIIISLFISQKRKFRHHQEKLDMKNNFDNELLRSRLEIQSQAFESISRELHDNVGTLISIAMVHVKSQGERKNGEDISKRDEVTSLLNEAMDALRDISKSINPENINRIGWQHSFVTELEKLRKTNLFNVQYTQEGEPFSIELKKQIILFRILQETLNNIIKHSHATRIEAEFIYSKPQLLIIIKDDGIGFNFKPDGQAVQGSGLKNMLARAAMLPATLEIESAPGSGTLIKLRYEELSIK
ncbi:MAG TPA: ATP-binding protein [Chitinophagaceae bacterium]|jgi:signal transduction histidine kinase|nr:ATP-binding protein [Chitinophagaceae bacterium]